VPLLLHSAKKRKAPGKGAFLNGREIMRKGRKRKIQAPARRGKAEAQRRNPHFVLCKHIISPKCGRNMKESGKADNTLIVPFGTKRCPFVFTITASLKEKIVENG